MNKTKKYKFDLGDHVLICGRPGLSVVSARGGIEFSSGGRLNMYQIEGHTLDLYPKQFCKQWMKLKNYKIQHK